MIDKVRPILSPSLRSTSHSTLHSTSLSTDAALRPRICVTLHDVAPLTWPACMRVLAAVREVADIPLTLLLVPRFHGTGPHARFERNMSTLLTRGHELALHGWTHLDEMPVHGPAAWLRRRFYTAGEGEFAALSEEAATARLHAGCEWFEAHGWPLQGFVAPAWLLSPGSWHALRRFPFIYTSTLNGLYALHAGDPVIDTPQQLHCRSQVYSTRSAWRRGMSIAWNSMLAKRQETHTAKALERAKKGKSAGNAKPWEAPPSIDTSIDASIDSSIETSVPPLVRLELHPRDADYPSVKRNWQRLLRGWLASREAVTTGAFMQDWQAWQARQTCPHGRPVRPLGATAADTSGRRAGCRS